VNKKLSLNFIGFLQALGLILYCGIVAILFWKGNKIFGKDPNYFGPLLFLVIFTTSALISALITLGYPTRLYLKTNDFKKPLKIILNMVVWLFVFILLTLSLLFYLKA